MLSYPRRDLDQPPISIDSWIKHWIDEGFTALENIAREGPYLFGKAVTMTDLCLAPQIDNARRLGAMLEAYSKLIEINRNLSALAAFDRARPENPPDADLPS